MYNTWYSDWSFSFVKGCVLVTSTFTVFPLVTFFGGWVLFENSFVGSRGYVREKQVACFSHRCEPLVVILVFIISDTLLLYKCFWNECAHSHQLRIFHSSFKSRHIFCSFIWGLWTKTKAWKNLSCHVCGLSVPGISLLPPLSMLKVL